MNILTTHPSRAFAAAALVTGGLLLSACGSSPGDHDASGMSGMSGMSGSMSGSPASQMMSDMPMAQGDGLSATKNGFTLRLKSALTTAMPLRFVITKDGMPATSYRTEQTKMLHLYLIREDLSGFQHLHPTMSADGAWSVTPATMAPGRYRVYAQFEPVGASEPLVLSAPVTVGDAVPSDPTSPTGAVSPGSRSSTVDGYRVTVDGALTRGGTVRVSFSKGGVPVTGLQPYLDTYAHVTGFREGDLAFTHLHPSDAVTSDGGGPDLRFMIEAPEPGTYRLFVQFMAGGSLHTAVITTAIS